MVGYLKKRPQLFVHRDIFDVKPKHVGAQHLDEVTAEREDGVDADGGQAELQRRDQALLEVGIQGANLLRVELADEGDGLEVLKAQRGELEQLQGHQRHDYVLFGKEIKHYLKIITLDVMRSKLIKCLKTC